MAKRVTGNVRVEPRASGRVWVAQFEGGASGRTRRVLGPAWVRDTGRENGRGATIWRAAAGSKPDETYLSPAEAQDALEAILAAERASAPAAKRSGKTWGDAADAWLDHVEHVRGVEPTTLYGYKTSIRRLDAEGLLKRTAPLRTITAQKIEAAQRDMLRTGKLKRATVWGRMYAVKAALAHAERQGWCKPVEFAAIPAPAPSVDFNVLEPSQVEAVARAAAVLAEADYPLVRGAKGAKPEDRRVHEPTLKIMRERRQVWAEVLRVLAYTGVRIGEARALRWGDIDFDGEVVRVYGNYPTSLKNPEEGAQRRKPKGKKGRSVPLIAPAVAALVRIGELGYPDGPTDPVFPNGTGGLVDAVGVREAFYAALGPAGVGHLRQDGKDDPIVLHDLRHTFGTIAVRVFPLHEVQEYMGHADIKTTMRYVHFVQRRDAAAKLTEAFSRDLNSASPLEDQAADAEAEPASG